MAVGYTSDTDALTDQTAGSVLYTGFAVSGVNPVIIVTTAFDSTTATVSSVVASAGLTSIDVGNGANNGLQIVTRRSDSGNNRTYVTAWALVKPAGTGTITVTFSASVAYESNALLLSGAHQATPCPTGDAVSSTTGTNPQTLTPTNLTANDAAVMIGANTVTGNAPAITTGTEIFNDNLGAVNAAAGYHLGTGVIAITWGTGSNDCASVAIRVVAAQARSWILSKPA